MKNLETGLDYCDVDLQEVRIHQSFYRHKRDWKDGYLELLQRSDYDAAHELRMKNDERYAEDCEQEAANVFPVKGSELKSLSEVESEKREMEAA